MTAAIKGVSIKERDASQIFVSFAELKLDLQAESIYRRAPILREVKLTDPYVHIVRNPDARTYNFSDLIEKFSKPKAARGDGPSEPPRFSLNNVQIVNGRIEIDDRPKHARHSVRAINVAIPFLSNLPYRIEEYVQPSFSARVNDTPFALQGRTKPFKDTLETSVDINIEKLNLPQLHRVCAGGACVPRALRIARHGADGVVRTLRKPASGALGQGQRRSAPVQPDRARWPAVAEPAAHRRAR